MSYQHSKILTHRPLLRKAEGMVVIMALFIVALVAAFSYVLLTRLQRDTERTLLILRYMEAENYAEGSLAWAKYVLQNNWEKKKPNEMIDRLPIRSPADRLQGYVVVSMIYDMQGRFNLNSLEKPEAEEGLRRLIQGILPNLSEEKVREIVRAAKDWINPAASKNVSNEFDRYYQALPIPYRAAHRPMTHASELRLVKGVTGAIYLALLPYVTALPNTAMININSADAPVLLTLGQNISLSTAQSLQELLRRTQAGTKEAVLKLDLIKNLDIKAERFEVQSSYFLVETIVKIENQRILLYTLLERMLKEGRQVVFRTVWQSKGIE